jgi:hypothetical protein
MWVVRGGTTVPGQDAPVNSIYLSDLRGEQIQMLFSEAGISAVWIDANRLLITRSQRPYTQLDVYVISEQRSYTLGRWYRPRGFSLAPGGSKLMFYLAAQPIAADNGVYWMETTEGAQPQRVAWFGGYRWRDGESLYYVPYQPDRYEQQIHYFEPVSGRDIPLTQVTILDGQWSVNADGNRILYRNAADRNLWIVDVQP